jgi:peptidyl-prolyl cis-trans isomerase SurA
MKKYTNNIFKKIAIILIFNIFLLPLKAAVDVRIITKINNEIITNIDIEEEYNYLIALNNDLKNLDIKSGFTIAKNSLIREKIKKNELEKYYNLDSEVPLLENVVENFYNKLNLNNEDEFKKYLNNFDLDFNDVRNKIKLELFWNRLIQEKFANQLNIDTRILEKKIKDESLTNKIAVSYNLSEIVFEIKDNDLETTLSKINESINTAGFKNTANIFSISNTAKFGGEIGWIEESKLSKTIIESLQSIDIGEITKPINIANGFLIVKLLDKKEEENLGDPKVILKDLIGYEQNRQFTQFSIMYFNKLRLNTSIINE